MFCSASTTGRSELAVGPELVAWDVIGAVGEELGEEGDFEELVESYALPVCDALGVKRAGADAVAKSDVGLLVDLQHLRGRVGGVGGDVGKVV